MPEAADCSAAGTEAVRPSLPPNAEPGGLGNAPAMQIRDCVVDPSIRPLVMGVLNVTPDSFSDGGRFFDRERAVARAQEMIAEGADMIDVGPESTRPGADDVPADEQIGRAVGVIRAIREFDPQVVISIDTRLGSVARAALDAGADMINDTSALRDDPALVTVAAESGAAVVLMHRRGTPKVMQAGGGPEYHDVIADIRNFLAARMQFAEQHGVDRSRIILDPGIGFGKRVNDNLMILRELPQFADLGRPLLVGASRKRFLGALLGLDRPEERLAGSLACAALATMSGAAILRVHDVRATVEVIRTCVAIRNARA